MKFTSTCKNNLLKAQEEAKSLRHSYVEPEHILWLELKVNDCNLNNFLDEKGISKAEFQGKLKERMLDLPRLASSGTREASERLKKIFEKINQNNQKDIDWADLVVEAIGIEKDPLTDVIWDSAIAPFEFREYIQGEQIIEKVTNEPTGKEDVLSKYCIDLIELARNGKLNPVIGRESEIRQMTTILSQKMTNNPILVGDPGVGKTQIVEGLALKILKNEAGPILTGKRILTLDIGLLLAGANYRGEFEERLKAIIKELGTAKGQIIIFIDEIHVLMGAGQTSGALDAANLIKPALARGELWLIGATTYAEFRKHIEKDAAFTRRFVRVNVPEPSYEETLEILTGIRTRFTEYHSAEIQDEQLKTIVNLCGRYIGDNQFPAKAIQVLDNTLARVKLSNVLGERESALVLNEDIADSIADKTGIPVQKIFQDESATLLNLEEKLSREITGQTTAIKTISNRLRVMSLPFRTSNKPRGIFLFLGPSGVGKTEMAKVICNELYASSKQLVRIDMTEYSDEHSSKRLVGADPGLIGYEEGGVLTEAIRRRPYSLVLLDEIDKAHKKVCQMFLQVFDDGRLTDNQGNTVNFSNTVFILTSNYGYSNLDFSTELDETKLFERAMDYLKNHVGTEFIKRIDEIVLFSFLKPEDVTKIIDNKLSEYTKAFSKEPGAKDVTIGISEDAREFVVKNGFQQEYGARSVLNYIDTVIANKIAEEILKKRQQSGGLFFPEKIEINLENEDYSILVQ